MTSSIIMTRHESRHPVAGLDGYRGGRVKPLARISRALVSRSDRVEGDPAGSRCVIVTRDRAHHDLFFCSMPCIASVARSRGFNGNTMACLGSFLVCESPLLIVFAVAARRHGSRARTFKWHYVEFHIVRTIRTDMT